MKKLQINNIFKLSPTPTSIVQANDPQFTFVKVNDAYCNMTKRSEEDLIGNSLFDSFPENPDEQKPTGPDRLLSSFRKIIKTKKEDELGTIRYDIVLDDGSYKEVYWRVTNTPILGEDGKVAFIMNSATKISEQVVSQRINKMMLDNSEDSFILIDKDLIIKNFNKSFAKNYKDIFGKVVEKGRSILDYAQPERREIVKGIYDQVLKGETVEGTLPLETQDGDTRYFNIKYKPARDENDEIVGSFISLIEKTEERKAKDALEKNEARYRSLVENSGDVVFILSPDAEPTYISPSIENVLGYTQEEAYNMEMMEVVHPDDVSIIFDELKRCLDQPGEPIEVTPARMRHKNGEYRWMEGTICNLLHDPNINGIVDNFRDITERFEYQRQIDEAKEQYEKLINTIDGIFWEADAETFIFNYVSPQSISLLGYKPEKWIGEQGFWKNKIHPEDRDEAVNYCHYKTQKGQNHTFEYRMQKSDGTYIWIRDVVTVITENGQPSTLQGLMIDITQEKELEYKLEQAYNLAKIGAWELNLQEDKLVWSDYVKNLHEVEKDYEPDLESSINFFKEGWSRERIQEVVEQAIEQGTPFDVELEIITAKGNELWVRAVGEPEFNNGSCTRLFGSTQDITQRKTLEQELENVYRMAKMGNWEVDLVQNSLYWSKMVRDIFEVDPDFQPDLDTAIEFYTEEESREVISEVVDKAIKDGSPYDVELEIKTAKGNKKWLRNIGQPKFKDGKCVRIYGTSQDVTDRKLAEIELKDSNLSLVERIKEQRCLYDISNLNEQELTTPELVEKATSLIPNGFQYPELTHAQISLNGQTFETEGFSAIDNDLVLTHKNERNKDIQITITVTLDKKKEAPEHVAELDFQEEEHTLLIGIANQIAQKVDQIQKRNEIQEAEKKYRNVVEHSTNMFYQHNIEGVLNYVSPQSKEFLGYPPEEAMRKWTEFITDHPINKEGEKLTKRAIETGEIQRPYKLQLLTGDDRIIWVEVHEAPLIEEGEVTGIVGSLTDITEREKYEDQLQQSLERYDYVSRATRDAIYDWDIKNNSLHWGEGFKKLFGHEPGDGKYPIEKYNQSVHPSDRDEAFDDLKFTLEDQSMNKWSYEYRFQKNDGSYAHVLENGYIIRDKDGDAIRMIGAIRDITEEKQTEIQTKLQHQVAQFFKKEDRLIPILGNLLHYLAEFEKFNIAEIWLVSGTKTHLNLMSSFARDGVGQKFYQQSEKVKRFEYGEGLPGVAWENNTIEIWHELHKYSKFVRNEAAKTSGLQSASALPLYYNEDLVGVLVLGSEEAGNYVQNKIQPYKILQDLLGAEIRRKQQEEEMQLLFESSPDILAITAPNKQFVKVNPAFCEILGYSEEELTSQSYENFVHPDDLEETKQEYQETISGERQAHDYINRWITKSGETRWISWSSSEVFGEDGYVFAFGHDITDRTELEQLLNQAQRMAKIGGWEIDFQSDELYWSSITKEIHEVEPDFEPDLETGIEFYKEGESRETILQVLQEAREEGKPWDVELQIVTEKGNEKWIRAQGEPEIIDGKCVRLYGSFQDIDDRKRAELELKEAHNDLRNILESIDEAFFSLDKNWTITYWNAKAEEIIGLKRKDVVGKNLWEIFPEARNYKFFTEYERAFVEQVEVHFEEYFPPFEQWFDAHGYPTEDGISVFFRDITDKKIAQQKILDINEKLETAQEIAHMGYWELDLESDAIFWSEQAYKIWGLDHEDTKITLDLILEKMHPEDRQKFIDHNERTLEEHVPLNMEHRILLEDGGVKWLQVIGNIKESEAGEPISLEGTVQDITKRKQADLELEEAYREKENILESIADGFFTLDRNWNVTYWNRAAESLLQTPKQNILGQNLWDVFQDAVDLPSYTNYHRVMHQRKPVSFEDYYEPIDRWFDINAYPSEEGISVFFKDISESKKAREALKELNEELELRAQELAASNAELEQFAYVASHDLQEPLRMVSSFLTQLDKKYGDELDDKATQYIHYAVDGAQRMRQIILDLLNYSRLNQEKSKREQVDLNVILEDVKVLERVHIEKSGAKIIADDLPTVYANPSPIKQVFQNLINNAIKYQENDNTPAIEITSSETDTHWKFEVRDNGIGIRKEFQDTIFQIFQRLHTRDQYSGTGIGLAITKKIIERHEGEIWLDSEEGEGSTFYFTISKE